MLLKRKRIIALHPDLANIYDEQYQKGLGFRNERLWVGKNEWEIPLYLMCLSTSSMWGAFAEKKIPPDGDFSRVSLKFLFLPLKG